MVLIRRPAINRFAEGQFEYYMGYNGREAETSRIRGRAAEFTEEQAAAIVRQLTALGFKDFAVEKPQRGQ